MLPPPPRFTHQKGIATLMLTIVILMIVTLTTLYTARVVVTDDKTFGNVYRNSQALNAAHAGFDYALGFLNSSMLNQEAVLTANTVTTTPSGVVSASGLNGCSVASNTATLTSPGALANGATFVMTYRCITINDVNTITIRSIGTSADGSSIRTFQGIVQRVQTSNIPFVPVGTTTFANNNISINNNVTNATIAIDTAAASVNRPANVNVQAGNPLGARCSTGTGACSAITLSDPNVTLATLQTRFIGVSLSTLCPSTSAAFIANPQVDYYVDCTGGANRTYNSSARTLSSPSGGAACTVSVAPGVTPANPTLASLSRRTVCFSMGANSITLGSGGGGSFTVGGSGPDIFLFNQNATDTVTLANNMNFTGGMYAGSAVNDTGNTATLVNGVLLSTGNYTMDSGTVITGVLLVGGTSSISTNNTTVTRTSGSYSNIMGGSLLGFAVVSGSMQDF